MDYLPEDCYECMWCVTAAAMPDVDPRVKVDVCAYTEHVPYRATPDIGRPNWCPITA